MLFMIIGEWPPENRKAILARRAEIGGASLPGQLHHWLAGGGGRSFTVADVNDVAQIVDGCFKWSDLIHFEVIPIGTPEQIMKAMAR